MASFKDMLKYLRTRENLSQSELAEKLNIAKSTVSMYEVGKREPDFETLEVIADFFNVDMNFLLGKEDPENKDALLSSKDERDIAKDLDNIMFKLTSGENGPANYNGDELDPEAAELFREELELALKRLKIINKEKYTPKKYKK